MAPFWRYSGAMSSIQIKSVPDDVHRELRRRASTAGKSLQEYLLAQLCEEARRPRLDDILLRVEEREGGRLSLAFATAAVREERSAR